MIVDYCFELETGDYVFVEMADGERVKNVRAYLEGQIDCEIERFVGIYSVEEAEELGYDTFQK